MKNFLILFIFPLVAECFFDFDPITITTRGIVQGIKVYTNSSPSSYEAFLGIPFAKPPVGDLRFRAPVKHNGWFGIRDASTKGNSCPSNGQVGLASGGNEDCLYLNVYTPSRFGYYPVYFWIYGGGFSASEDEMLQLTPEYAVMENMVVVTSNYRLGVLGFLSTGDKHAQGNYGLKDILLALEWTQENIRFFGGDPNQVTLYGHSAGAIAIQIFLTSNIPDNLFNKAIMTSGSVLTPIVFQPEPLEQAQKFAQSLNITSNSTQELVQKLRNLPFEKILAADPGAIVPPIAINIIDFAPCVEPEDSIESRLIVNTPTWNFVNGNFRNIPILIGTTNMEGLFGAFEILLLPQIIDFYNQNFGLFVPPSYELSSTSPQVQEVANFLRQKYFNGQNISANLIQNFAKFETDLLFKFPVDRIVKFFTKKDKSTPIYYYEFSYEGMFPIAKTLVGLNSLFGVAHGDDLSYMHKSPFQIYNGTSDHAITVRKRVVRMHANFAKYGNPTPVIDDLITTAWPKYSDNSEFYMDIGYDLTVKQGFPDLEPLRNYQKNLTGHL